MESKDLIKKAVDQINARSIESIEKHVRQTVDEIIHYESTIQHATKKIAELKEMLRELQLPPTVTLEL